MEYKLTESEYYRDYVHLALEGKVDEEEEKQILFLLEIIVTGIATATYTISISVNAKEIVISIVHHGKAIDDNIISIIEEQVDHISYRHQAKDKHELKIRKKKREKRKVNYFIFRQISQ